MILVLTRDWTKLGKNEAQFLNLFLLDLIHPQIINREIENLLSTKAKNTKE